MADPITATAVGSMAATAAGGVVSGLGAGEAGQAQASAYRYKAGVAMLNKQINEQNAAWALESGQTQGMESGMKSGQEIAQNKVVQSGSGFDVNTGTAAVVRSDENKVAQFDQNVINWNAAKTSYGFETKATMDVAESNLDQMAASQSEEAGTLSEISSFLGAAGSVSSKWMQGKSAGAFA